MAGTKRKQAEDSNGELYNNKSRSKPSAVARVDPTYGQRGAIPLDEDSNENDGELNYGEDIDALAYLRSVRREAEGIPNLIVAPKVSEQVDDREIYNNGIGDFRGRYEDGAFFAGPDGELDDFVDQEGLQSKYFEGILTRFEALRTHLNQNPPLEALQKLDDEHPIYLGKFTAEKVRWWRWKMRTTDPLPAQVAAMDKDTVLGLLKLLSTGNLLRRGVEVDLGVSRWAWSLLAKLPDRGALSSEEIGIVRELGKKAVLIGVGIREGNKWDEEIQEVEAAYDEGDGADVEIDVGEEDITAEAGLDDEEDIYIDKGSISEDNIRTDSTNANEVSPQATVPSGQEDLAAAKSRILGLLSNSNSNLEFQVDVLTSVPPKIGIEEANEDPDIPPSEEAPKTYDSSLQKFNSNATVDMIITIAGETYGQRDLLEFRGNWGEAV